MTGLQKRRTTILGLAILLLTVLLPAQNLALAERQVDGLGEPKTGINVVSPLKEAGTSPRIAVLQVGSLALWKEGRYQIRDAVFPEYVIDSAHRICPEIEKTLMRYQCTLLTAEECYSKARMAMVKENRPNPLSPLAAYPPAILSLIPKYHVKLPRETEGQKKFADFHQRAVKAVGEYLDVDCILTVCLAYDEENDRLFAFFEVYDTTSGKGILHVVGAGSYANPKGSSAEKDAIDSGLVIGLDKLGLKLRQQAEE